jgi:hypothetical protein
MMRLYSASISFSIYPNANCTGNFTYQKTDIENGSCFLYQNNSNTPIYSKISYGSIIQYSGNCVETNCSSCTGGFNISNPNFSNSSTASISDKYCYSNNLQTGNNGYYFTYNSSSTIIRIFSILLICLLIVQF